MKRLFATFLIICFVNAFVKGQLILEPHMDITVSDGEKELGTPWTGGLNSGQYGKVDLDGDGGEEVVVYDRSARIYQIFKEDNQAYTPANDLCVFLPEIPDGWVLLVDYDGDGKKDIFSNGERGVIVLKNTSAAGEPAQWEKIADPLLTTGFSGKINLIANSADVPAITDIDSDGDIDILVYNFAIGGYIRYNKNLSMERYGHADSLEYEINTRSWGEFEECDCNSFTFSGETCEGLSNGRVTHPGGKALLAFDSDGDGDKDLLVGHEQCVELYFYENMGDRDSAYMVDFSSMFPEETKPANFHIFPAGYFEDLDFDGVKDLVVTPSFEENYEFKIDFAHSNWFYKNTNTDDNPDFEYQQDDILQKEGLDFGENSVPATADLNADGNTDLLVAANGYWNGDHFSGYVHELRNNGSSVNPSFIVASTDYLGLSSLDLVNPIISLVDFNGDSAVDIVYSGMALQHFELQSWLIPNQSEARQPVSFDINSRVMIPLPESTSSGDSPAFADVDEDGYVDLLLGKKNGALEYYRNKSDNTFELINPAYLGIERDFSQEKLNLVASVADIDEDGQQDLIVTDASGSGRIYFEFKRQDDGTPHSVDAVYKNSISNLDEKIKFDAKTWIAGADLFGYGTGSIIAGGIRGGLQFYKNNSFGGGLTGKPVVVKLFPNPLFDTQEININANQNVTVELISVLGQKLRAPFNVEKFTPVILDVGHLRNGPYILRSVTQSGASTSQLFVIQR
jgi:hypothetical protein